MAATGGGPAEAGTPAASGARASRLKTALIVEDEIFVALDLERILLDAGYDVAAIAAGADSVETSIAPFANGNWDTAAIKTVLAIGVFLDGTTAAGRDLCQRYKEVRDACLDELIKLGVAAGVVGAPPAPRGTDFQLAINTQGRLTSEEEFADVLADAQRLGYARSGAFEAL